MSNERTVRHLTGLGQKIYVYLRSDEVGKRFLSAAESEGFTFGDGAKPADRHYATVMAVNRDGTINYVGAAGMAAFGAKAKEIVRVDFEAYAEGDDNYVLH